MRPIGKFSPFSSLSFSLGFCYQSAPMLSIIIALNCNSKRLTLYEKGGKGGNYSICPVAHDFFPTLETRQQSFLLGLRFACKTEPLVNESQRGLKIGKTYYSLNRSFNDRSTIAQKTKEDVGEAAVVQPCVSIEIGKEKRRCSASLPPPPPPPSAFVRGWQRPIF
jgi:hypothetical protein